MRPDCKKIAFLVFPRKKMVSDRKTSFFLRKRWFLREKPSSSWKRWFWEGKPTFS